MNGPQGWYDKCAKHNRLAELALKDPVVRFAVEHYGAQVVAVHPGPGEVDMHTDGQDSEDGKKSKPPNGYL